jgi:hypothetical protein
MYACCYTSIFFKNFVYLYELFSAAEPDVGENASTLRLIDAMDWNTDLVLNWLGSMEFITSAEMDAFSGKLFFTFHHSMIAGTLMILMRLMKIFLEIPTFLCPLLEKCS